jgi:hypothetical protein
MGCGSGIGKKTSIQDPGVKKAPDPGSASTTMKKYNHPAKSCLSGHFERTKEFVILFTVHVICIFIDKL